MAAYLLIFQGFYYIIFGLWAIVHIESFSAFTRYRGDFFLKHTAAILFLALGAVFLYGGWYQRALREFSLLLLAFCVGLMFVELYYLPRIGNPLPFWIDFTEHLFVALASAFSLSSMKK